MSFRSNIGIIESSKFQFNDNALAYFDEVGVVDSANQRWLSELADMLDSTGKPWLYLSGRDGLTNGSGLFWSSMNSSSDSDIKFDIVNPSWSATGLELGTTGYAGYQLRDLPEFFEAGGSPPDMTFISRAKSAGGYTANAPNHGILQLGLVGNTGPENGVVYATTTSLVAGEKEIFRSVNGGIGSAVYTTSGSDYVDTFHNVTLNFKADYSIHTPTLHINELGLVLTTTGSFRFNYENSGNNYRVHIGAERDLLGGVDTTVFDGVIHDWILSSANIGSVLASQIRAHLVAGP